MQNNFYNLDAEASILGSIILNNFNLLKVSHLTPDSFYATAHQKIFEQILRFAGQDISQNQVTLKQFFDNEESIKELGGKSYLSTLLSQASGIVSISEYAKIIEDLSLKRSLATIPFKVENLLSDASKNSQEIKDELQDDIDQITVRTSDNKMRSISDIVESVIEKSKSERVDLVKTHYSELDDVLGGLYPGALVILAGRPGMGKSTFGLNLAMNVATKGQVAFLSLEMGDEELGAKVLTRVASINPYRLKHGNLNQSEIESLNKSKEKISKLDLHVDDTGAINLSQLRFRLKKLTVSKPLKLLVIDYLQLMKAEGRQQSRDREIGSISEGLKALAKEFKVPIIALSQLSRASEKRESRRPILSDLRDSGSLEQDADIVMFVHRDDYYLEQDKPDENDKEFFQWQELMSRAKGKAFVIVQKNRNGKTGEIPFNFDPEFSRFIETKEN